MTKILFLGDSAGTGFGSVTKGLGSALLALGEDVRFLSLNEQPDGELEEPFKDRTAILGQNSGWLGMEDPAVLAGRLEGMFTGSLFEDGWTPDASIVLGDMGSLKVSPVLRFLPKGFPAFHYVPIEGLGIPPAWGVVWRTLRPVATSNFGADEIARVTGERPPMIWHGIDHEAFYPVTPARPIVLRVKNDLVVLRSKADCRKFLGWPAHEIILYRADRHMPRKAFAAMYRSLAPVLARHANVRLITHCLLVDQGGDLNDEISHYPPPIASRMNVTGIGGRADAKLLAAMYNAADLYISTCAEGFGLTIAESLACGVPAVGLDYSSVPEVIGPAGVAVPAGLVDNIYSHFWATPIEAEYTKAVEELVADTARRQVLGMKGPHHVAQFTWTHAAEQFRDLVAVRQEAAA